MTATIDRIVTLTSVSNEMEGGLIVAALENEGIFARMNGDTLAGFRAEAPAWVQIIVFERDRARAEAVLRRIADNREHDHRSEGEIDDAGDVSASTGIVSLKVWRRVAQVLIILYLAWLSIGLVGVAIRIASNFIQGIIRATIG
jgi:hypothetical protein